MSAGCLPPISLTHTATHAIGARAGSERCAVPRVIGPGIEAPVPAPLRGSRGVGSAPYPSPKLVQKSTRPLFPNFFVQMSAYGSA